MLRRETPSLSGLGQLLDVRPVLPSAARLLVGRKSEESRRVAAHEQVLYPRFAWTGWELAEVVAEIPKVHRSMSGRAPVRAAVPVESGIVARHRPQPPRRQRTETGIPWAEFLTGGSCGGILRFLNRPAKDSGLKKSAPVPGSPNFGVAPKCDADHRCGIMPKIAPRTQSVNSPPTCPGQGDSDHSRFVARYRRQPT